MKRSTAGALRRALSIGGAVAALTLLTACSGGGGASSGTDASVGGDTLRIAVSPVVAPTVLDPATGASTGPDIFFDLAYEPLIRIDADGEFTPALAESWGYVDGSSSTQFELTLRDDAKFSDGTDVTAASVAAWLDYYQQAGGGFANALGIGTTIEATSDYDVLITMPAPNPDVQWLLSQTNGMGFVAAAAGLEGGALESATYGAGQYVYDADASVPGDTYTLVPNEYYYDQSAIVWKQVVIKVVASETSLVQGMTSGQFDVGVGAIGTIPTAESAGLNVITGPLSWDGITINDRATEPYSDVRVRQALNYAIDRETLVAGVLDGQGTPTSSWVTLDGSDPDSEALYDYDPDKAADLLDEAGYPDGITFRLLAASGPLTSGTPSDTLVQAMAQQMEAAGITLDTTFVPAGQLITELLSGQYDGALFSFGINSYATYYPIFVAPQAFLNLGKVTEPTLEELTTEYLSSSDPSSVSQEITRYVAEQALEVPIFVPQAVMFTTQDISGVVFPSGEDGLGQAIFPDPTQWR